MYKMLQYVHNHFKNKLSLLFSKDALNWSNMPIKTFIVWYYKIWYFICSSSINKLQVVQNAAARVLTRSRKYDHITPILQSLNWLPNKFRISYKILLLAYKALNDLAPAYLTSLLSRYNPTRSLRSQNSGLLVVPRIAKSTKGGRTF